MEKKIFIIEDDANTLASLQAKFSTIGYEVISHNGVGSYHELLAMMKEAKPSFVVLDLMLPEIDGFELLRSIKADDILSYVPVFVFTNFSDNDTKERCDKLGADHFFVKSDFDNVDAFVGVALK